MVGRIGIGGGSGRKGRFLVNFAVVLKSGVSECGGRLTWFGPRVASSDRGDVVVVIVAPLPKRRGGARFLEASHGNTIIFRGNSQLAYKRGKDNSGLLVASGVLLLRRSGVSVGGHVIVWFIQEL